MEDSFHHKEPIIVIATQTCVAEAWAKKSLNSFARRPICLGYDNSERALCGSRGRVIILVDIPDLGPLQYRGKHNTIITLKP